MDLTRRDPEPCIEMVQDDKYSRDVQISLLSGGVPFLLPEDCSVLIRYKKRDGMGGTYDTMPDGTSAWTIGENRVTIRIAPQVCTVAGDASMTVTLMSGDAELSCFEMNLRIQPVRCGWMHSEPYENVKLYLPQPAAAKTGEYLRVTEVDENGAVTGLETAQVEAGNGQADWNAAEGEAGHVLNRTHWTQMGEVVQIDGEYVSEFIQEFGVYGVNAYFQSGYESVPEKLSIVFDGAEYRDLKVTKLEGLGSVTGNLYFMNDLMGTSFENTGEPFLAGVGTAGVTIMTTETESTRHTVVVLGPGEVVHKLDRKFIPEDVGAVPDWNAKEGEPGYVQNRTHFTTQSENDAVYSGEFIQYDTFYQYPGMDGMYLIKISQEIPEVSTLAGRTLTYWLNGSEQYLVLTADNIVDGRPDVPLFGVNVSLSEDEIYQLIVCLPESVDMGGTMYEAGLYFADYYMGTSRIYPVSLEGVKLSGYSKLSKSFLPTPRDFLYDINVTENDDGTYSIDKTWQEIVAASNKGYTPQCIMPDASILPMVACFNGLIFAFAGIYGNLWVGSGIDGYMLIMINDEVTRFIPIGVPNPQPVTFLNARYAGPIVVAQNRYGDLTYDGTEELKLKGLPCTYPLKIRYGTYIGDAETDLTNQVKWCAEDVLEDNPTIILTSSTEGSTKRFKLTVDDTGAVSAAEVTE